MVQIKNFPVIQVFIINLTITSLNATYEGNAIS